MAAGLLVTGWLWAGEPRFWRLVVEFAATPEVLPYLSMAATAAAAIVLSGRTLTNLYGWSSPAGGLAAGVIVPAAFASFLVSTQATQWGGLLSAMRRTAPEALLFAIPFAVSGLVTSWLWDRLD